MTPKMAALTVAIYEVGSWASALNEARYAPGVPFYSTTLNT